MSIIDLSRQRLQSVIEEIERLKQSEFPYKQPLQALEVLRQKFIGQQVTLAKVPEQASDLAGHHCSLTLDLLSGCVPYLGFILRSTNVRNAFETYAPLHRLAQSILGKDTKLILSSEWEFSPYVYRSIPELPGFVLIGLPAPESSNPLLVPLAGHELGHSVWAAAGLGMQLQKRIEDGVQEELTTNQWEEYEAIYPQFTKHDIRDGNRSARPTWVRACQWASFQTEEIFCDLFGLRLFSESYLHAFMYLLAPGFSGQRFSFDYPTLKRRVEHLVESAKALGVSTPQGLEKAFVDQNEPDEPTTKLLVSVADTVSASLAHDLHDFAWQFADSKGVPKAGQAQVNDISEEFREKVVPTSTPRTLADVLNAGWKCHLDKDLWKEMGHIRPQDRHRILADLILKSMEVAEIHELLEDSA